MARKTSDVTKTNSVASPRKTQRMVLNLEEDEVGAGNVEDDIDSPLKVSDVMSSSTKAAVAIISSLLV